MVDITSDVNERSGLKCGVFSRLFSCMVVFIFISRLKIGLWVME